MKIYEKYILNLLLSRFCVILLCVSIFGIFQEMAKEGVDIFDLSSPFYTDVCFQYNSKKDIALKDRVLLYFPNVSLCDDNCINKGVDLKAMESICYCSFNDLSQNSFISNSMKYNEVFETIYSFIKVWVAS